MLTSTLVAPQVYCELGRIGAERVVVWASAGGYVRMSFRPNTAHEASNSTPTVTP